MKRRPGARRSKAVSVGKRKLTKSAKARRPSISSLAEAVKRGKISRQKFTAARDSIRRQSAKQLRDRLDREMAVSARDAYKPRKKDLGKIILVGQKGARDPQAKGRKGFPAYVTRTGKVRLLKVGHLARPYKPRRMREIEIPIRRGLQKQGREFQKRRIKTLARGLVRQTEPSRESVKKVVKSVGRLGLTGEPAAQLQDFRLGTRGRGHGKVKTGGAHDFNERAVNTLSKSIQKTIKGQAGQRQFVIRVMGLLRLPDGRKEVMEFFVDIARNDRDAIRIGGIENFVRQKFYAYMARQLAFMGLVSVGSRNHIRRLEVNKGLPEGQWVDRRGDAWAGRDLDVAQIEQLEWKIEQA